MSKIAILLTGVSYGMRTETRVVNTDWNLAKQSIKQNIIEPFISLGHDVNVYMTTYVHDQLLDMINFYNPKKVLLLRYQGSHQRITYMQSLMQLLSEDVDFIVATRFDIKFLQTLTSYPINYEKFNFTFRQIGDWWDNHEYVDDNLFIFPKKFLVPLINAINEFHINPYMGRRNSDLHPVYKYLNQLIGLDDINFLMEGKHASHDNMFFELTGNGEKYKTVLNDDGSTTYIYTMFDKTGSHTLAPNELQNISDKNKVTRQQVEDSVFAFLKSKVLS